MVSVHSHPCISFTLYCLKGGSTNAGMDWNGMDYWNVLQGSNSQLLFFHTLSNRVSIPHSYENAWKNCIRINGGILCENWSWCGQCMHATASHRPSHSCHPISVIVISYADILCCHTAPFPPISCVSFPQLPLITYAFSRIWGEGGDAI